MVLVLTINNLQWRKNILQAKTILQTYFLKNCIISAQQNKRKFKFFDTTIFKEILDKKSIFHMKIGMGHIQQNIDF